MRRQPSLDLSRRRLLQSIGLGAAALPLLPLLNASAQASPRPKRLILVWGPDGAPALNYNTTVDWKPQGTETSFTLQSIQTPLQAFASKLVIPWGLTLTAKGAGENHAFGMAGVWTASTLHPPSAGANFDGGNGNRTGWGSGPSIDQIIAKAYGPKMPYQRAADDPNPETRYRSVELGIQCQGPTSLNRMIYAGDNSPIHPEVNAKAAFDRLFAGVTSSAQKAVTPAPTTPSPVQAEQRALVDYLKDDLGKIRTRVGSGDYQKIDAHLEGLLALERRVNAPASGSGILGTNCVVPTGPGTATDYPTGIHNMMDIASAALACDVTRVVSIQMSYAFSHILHKWLGHTSDHHTMSHDGTDRRKELQQIDAWYAGNVAYLLGKLDAIPEGNGTMLDNTLVVYGRELGSTLHRMDRWPVVLAGGAGGALVTGRALNVDGQQHVKLLVSIARMMGLETETIGNLQPNSGPLAGIG